MYPIFAIGEIAWPERRASGPSAGLPKRLRKKSSQVCKRRRRLDTLWGLAWLASVNDANAERPGRGDVAFNAIPNIDRSAWCAASIVQCALEETVALRKAFPAGRYEQIDEVCDAEPGDRRFLGIVRPLGHDHDLPAWQT